MCLKEATFQNLECGFKHSIFHELVTFTLCLNPHSKFCNVASSLRHKADTDSPGFGIRKETKWRLLYIFLMKVHQWVKNQTHQKKDFMWKLWFFLCDEKNSCWNSWVTVLFLSQIKAKFSFSFQEFFLPAGIHVFLVDSCKCTVMPQERGTRNNNSSQ